INAVPGAQSTNEDTNLIFSSGNGNQISISDVDAGSGSVRVTLTATNGTLTLSGLAGLSFTAGDGTADATMTFSGTMANINGAAAVQIVTNDMGNTGSGGSLSDTDTVNVTVNAVNDAPVNSVPAAQSTNEDTTLVFSAANGNAISLADLDVNEGTGLVRVTL